MPGIVKQILSVYAVGFGFGLLPKMPGTWGTLPALLMAWPLTFLWVGYQVVAYVILLVLAYYAADYRGRCLGDHDHKSIVCDEIIGILPVLFFYPIAMWWLVFILFRVADIVKPWPICAADAHIKGAWGCLLDDIMAGMLVFVVLYWLHPI